MGTRNDIKPGNQNYYQQLFHFITVDLTKAFETVNHNILLTTKVYINFE